MHPLDGLPGTGRCLKVINHMNTFDHQYFILGFDLTPDFGC